MGMVRLARRSNLGNVERPFLVIYSLQDEVINPQLVEATFEQLGTTDKQLILFNSSHDSSSHVLAGDILSPSGTEPILQMILSFMQERM
jgi:esterase/lipase